MITHDKEKRKTSSVLFSSEKAMSKYGSIINKKQLIAYGGEKASPNDTAEDPFVKNLTLDGVKEGAYMLCKHSDDLLGHRARQAFREKAASIRGENGIYYYLKELMQTFGSERDISDASNSLDASRFCISMDIHEFRKMIMSDPAFAVAIATDQIDALFHRIERDKCNLITHQEIVEFCLLDRSQLRLLLYKYRKHLKLLKLSEIETNEYFNRLVSTQRSYVSPELLHAAITRDLDVVLTTGEISYLLNLLDSDHDGFVKINDFEYLLQSDQNVQNLIYPPKEDAIVDIRISAVESDEIAFQREGFAQLLPSVSDKASGGNSMFLWFKSASREEGKTGIEHIRYANTSRDTQLVAKGFTCLLQDIGTGGLFSKQLFMWISHAVPNMPNSTELIDISVTVGDFDDQADARLWLPMFRGFKLIPGNLYTNSSKTGIFLWVRRRHKLGSSLRNIDIIEPQSWTQNILSSEATLDSEYSMSIFYDSWKFLSHLDDLEAHVRLTLRRNCPRDQDAALNFVRLFQTFVNKNVQRLNRPQLFQGMESLGVKINKKDLQHLWERMNPNDNKFLSSEDFSRFLELTDTEMYMMLVSCNDVLTMFQRSLTANAGSNGPNYRLIFQSHNALGDGKLSRTDFERLFAFHYSNFTNAELSQVIMRLDINRDGTVDYSDFLCYVTGVCDESCRAAQRIAAAAEVFRSWVMEKQSKKLVKNGKVDISIAWRALKPKHGLIDPIAIDHILRESNFRLQATHIGQVMVLIAPATKGQVTQAILHEFVNYLPRKMTSVAYDMKKLVSCVSPWTGENMLSEAFSAVDNRSTFDRLNIERNGKLTLVKLWEQVKLFSVGRNDAALCPNLRDFAYLVQWTGADCGGHGSILIDRFLAAVLEIQERRNMKIEFITHYDSPQFCDGVQILRQELRRCAKTLDGKYNFRIPFGLLDKDKSGFIVASEFEEAIRELGIQKYMSDQEVKSLMRRFDLNADGGINFDEFLRFNLAESSSSVSAASPDFGNKREYISRDRRDTENGSDIDAVLQKIVMQEHLNSTTIVTFCASMQRMFGILDRESSGSISPRTFEQVIRELGLISDENDMKKLVDAFSSDQSQKKLYYREFCDKLEQRAILRGYHSSKEEEHLSEGPLQADNVYCQPEEAMKLLRRLHAEYRDLLRHLPKEEHEVCKDVFREAFYMDKDCENQLISLNVEELRELLWRARLHHPFLREELETLLQCFTVINNNVKGFSVHLFLDLLDKGPTPTFLTTSTKNVSVLFEDHVKRLQKAIQDYIDADGDGSDSQERLIKSFRHYDADHNGSISRKEFMFMLDKAGLRPHLKRGDKDETLLLQLMDVNGDGEVGIDEFVTFVTNADINLVKKKPVVKPGNITKSGEDAPLQSVPRQEYLESSQTAEMIQKPKKEIECEPADLKASVKAANELINLNDKAHTELMRQIAICNCDLPEKFPFKRIFQKHCIKMASSKKPKEEENSTSTQNAVIMDIFQDVFDKFIQDLMKKRITFNMRTFDATRVSLPYVRPIDSSESFVYFDLFLQDLKRAECEMGQSKPKQSSGSECPERVACTNKNKSACVVHKVIARAIRDAYQNEKDLRSLRLQLECVKYERVQSRSTGPKNKTASEQDVFDVLIRLGLHLDAHDLEQCVLPTIEVAKDPGRPSGFISYNIENLISIIQEELYAAMEAKKDASENVTKKRSDLSQSLRTRLVKCLVNAAQNNISGRKLLERCDLNNTGLISALECQTVLRILDCDISTNDMSEIEEQFGIKKKDGGFFKIRYNELLDLLKLYEAQERKSHDLNMKLPGSPTFANNKPKESHIRQAPNLSTEYRAQDTDDFRNRLKFALMEVTSLRGVTLEQLRHSVRAYDVNGTGFVTAEGLVAALRRLDIILSAEAYESMIRCFRAGDSQSDRINYIELLDMLGAKGVANFDTFFSSIPTHSKCDPLSSSLYHQVTEPVSKSPVKQCQTSSITPLRARQSSQRPNPAAPQYGYHKMDEKKWSCHLKILLKLPTERYNNV
uniref:Uncharacterized protein AlNc14C33G3037 n=1 Tax=Albugo laibachii Nc14 TaxID=890382 RepID=F0W877_9STRA|nr:conserved hypothetical protein [Albugo laibachii Nc14]|eukprot:CCA17361.1 conserved hypothetical protein [Albugo laibachii Nc14]